jgi:hypothetical protein
MDLQQYLADIRLKTMSQVLGSAFGGPVAGHRGDRVVLVALQGRR